MPHLIRPVFANLQNSPLFRWRFTMTRLPLTRILAAMMMALPATTFAADACCPADAAKSAGGATVQTVADGPAKELPPGHPPMGGSRGGMGGMGGGKMPPGHPPMSGAQQPAEPFQANLVIKIAQGTKDGKEPADLPVTVDFYQMGKIVHTVKATSDAKGVAMFDNVALPGSCQPLVTVTYAGVPFQSAGKPMSAAAADQMVRTSIYEITNEAPQWEVAMRHVMVEQAAMGALHVSEVIAIRNPSDRAWLGKVVGEGEAYQGPKRVVVQFALPKGAKHVSLGRGFNPEFSNGEGLTITNWAPMLPGATEFRYEYVMAAKDGTIDLDLAAPTVTRSMMIFLPDGVKSSSNGQVKVFPASENGPAMKLYEWKDLAGGASATVKLEGLGTLTPAKPQASAAAPVEAEEADEHAGHDHAAEAPEKARGPRAIAGLGAGALVLGAVAFLLMKPQKKAR
jgi:hypothetical protein